MKYDPIMCMMVDDSVKTKDESYIVRGRKYKVLKREGDNVTVKGPDGKAMNMHIDFLMSEGKKVFDKKTGVHDADPIAALSNFKKTAEYGDSIKIDIGKGKTAIVQKEANGWYATIGNEKVKGTFNVIAGYLKSASAKDSASAIDKAIKTCDASSITYNEIKSVYNLVSDALMYRNDEKKVTELLRKAQSELLTLATKTK